MSATTATPAASKSAHSADQNGQKKAPRYVRPDTFFNTLRRRVNAHFEETGTSKTGNAQMYVKTTVMLLLFLTPIVLIPLQLLGTWSVVPLYALIGLGSAGIGLCVMHDANHGSFSSNKSLNKVMSFTMNLIGGSAFTWKMQHNVLHHTYTNIYEMDEDIHDKPGLRLSPHGKQRWYHKLQHIYFPALYSLATLSWVLLKDFRQLKTYNKEGLTDKYGYNRHKQTWLMIATKLVYLGAIIALPIAVGVPVWAVMIGFVVAHMISGLYITTVFQLAHVVEGPEHFVPAPGGTMEDTWAEHQIRTTANFASRSALVTWLTGGLNHQIEHHLFPHICHVHYQKISRIVRETAAEFDLPYYEHKRIGEAIASHIRVLRAFGTAPAA